MTARHVLAPRKPIYALEAALRALRVPTLVVYGERDEACLQSSEFQGRTIPGSHVWKVPGATHFVNLDAPAAFNRRVQGFLEGH